jgi:PPOX class probable F420-dependent enzyme
MKLNDAARELIGAGADATLITLNPDGSPQATLVWMAWESTPDGDELVTAHLAEHQKIRNVRRDPRVAVTIVHPGKVGEFMRPYLSITGTARVVEGGAKELLKKLAQTLAAPGTAFPPDDAPDGWLTRIRIDKVGGVGPWSSRPPSGE